MRRTKNLLSKIDDYFENNYQDTIFLNHLYAIRTVQRINTNYKFIINKLIKTEDDLVFKRYLSRNQLKTFVDKISVATKGVKKILTNRLISSIEKCDVDDLSCRVNVFQLIGANGRAESFDFLGALEHDIKSQHATLKFSYLNISVYKSKAPYETVEQIFCELDNNDKLRRFYFSYLRYYYKGVDNIFKRFSESVQDNHKKQIAVLFPALDTVLRQHRYKSEIQGNLLRHHDFFAKALGAAPSEVAVRFENSFDNIHDKGVA
ncbi:hypothetical protein [Fundidesulfovibrio terrae]|uniref:hypothetical protein n=1 Tax=Fundidesulfovibrio terrae TaxID=2922866 RepID=UPI001FAE98A4|nr:hypothetical protein [Fundidesulfovibrio terrae]